VTSGLEVFERLPDIAGVSYFESRLDCVPDTLEKSDISLIILGSVTFSLLMIFD
jgi:hypothetical protein